MIWSSDSRRGTREYCINTMHACFLVWFQDFILPFKLACETKNVKLVCVALSTFQKLLANQAVSDKGLDMIVDALLAVRER